MAGIRYLLKVTWIELPESDSYNFTYKYYDENGNAI